MPCHLAVRPADVTVFKIYASGSAEELLQDGFRTHPFSAQDGTAKVPLRQRPRRIKSHFTQLLATQWGPEVAVVARPCLLEPVRGSSSRGPLRQRTAPPEDRSGRGPFRQRTTPAEDCSGRGPLWQGTTLAEDPLAEDGW